MKMSLSEMTCKDRVRFGTMLKYSARGLIGPSRTYIFVSQVLEELEFSVGALRQNGSAEGLHNLLDGDILVRELIARRAVKRSVCDQIL